MATPQFRAYALTTLPSSGIDTGGLYFIKQGSSNTFNIYIRDNSDTGWLDLGTTQASVDTVNSLTGNVLIDLVFSGGKLKISASGNGTEWVTSEIDLDARYSQIGHSHIISDISGLQAALNLKANDADVVHKTGNESISGTKTFTNSPEVPEPVNNSHASSKKYVDDSVGAIQTIVDQIVGSGVRIIGEIDASTNPNFPTNPTGTKKGDAWIITVTGKIGGPSGRQVDVGNVIIAKIDGANPGDLATSESDWIIVQSDLDQATETVKGFARIATQSEADGGTRDDLIISPKKLDKRLVDLGTSLLGSHVRYDVNNQGLNVTQRGNARTNIGAAFVDDVVNKAGTQTITGLKTFSSSPKVPNASANNEAVNLGQLNTLTEGKFVRYDVSNQGLSTANKTNARTNIDAASLEDIKWAEKDW